MRKHIDFFNQQAPLEHEEETLEYQIDRFTQAMTHATFEQLMRNQQFVSERLQDAPTTHGLSDLEILLPQTDLSKELPFTAQYVETARSSDKMKSLETITHSIIYHEEEPNPEYPHVDPNKEKRWVQRSQEVRIVTYDCNDPEDHQADYIEVFRIKGGVAEKTPAMKVFRSQGSESLNVIVIDKDTIGMRGHGVPDTVFGLVNGLNTGKDLLQEKYQHFLHMLFTKPKQEKRQLPEEPLTTNVQIVRVGQITHDEYTINPQGWKIPLDRYNQGDNYTLWVKYVDEKSTQPVLEKRLKRLHQIEYIAKRFFVPSNSHEDVQGRVVEYYHPKPEFAKNAKNVMVNNATHTIQILYPGKPIADGPDSFFFENRPHDDPNDPKPYRIDYDEGGNRRISLVDNDNKLHAQSPYEAKKEIARPHEPDLRQDAIVQPQ